MGKAFEKEIKYMDKKAVMEEDGYASLVRWVSALWERSSRKTNKAPLAAPPGQPKQKPKRNHQIKYPCTYLTHTLGMG